MATTLPEAIAQWKTENPLGSSGYEFSQSEYDTLAADRGAMMLLRDQRQAAEITEQQMRQLIKNRLTILDAGTATNAQVQQTLAFLIRRLL